MVNTLHSDAYLKTACNRHFTQDDSLNLIESKSIHINRAIELHQQQQQQWHRKTMETF